MTTRASIPQLISLTLLTASANGCFLFGGGDCGDETMTPVVVEEWNVDMARYDAIVESHYEYGSTSWAQRDDESRCWLACAYASGNAYEYSSSSYADLVIDTCELTIPSEDGDGTLNCTATLSRTPQCIGGRRPLGWDADPGAITSVDHQLVGMATMEQVSITAFIELGAQLEARGAPTGLVARCQAAAEDERRHVELLVGLGANPPAVTPEPAASTTSLIDIALHNATEGCVTETWAALLARYQSDNAAELATREALAEIADDEARHAQLAWDLHDWLCRRLEPSAAAQVEAARARALAELEATVSQQAMATPAEVRRALGLPDPRTAAALARNFGRRLAAA